MWIPANVVLCYCWIGNITHYSFNVIVPLRKSLSVILVIDFYCIYILINEKRQSQKALTAIYLHINEVASLFLFIFP